MSYTIPIAFFDPPLVIDTSVTSIPAISSTPLQVIASTGLQTGVGINYSDTTGDFIGVYVGPQGQEQLACIIGNGLTAQGWAKIPAGSRISLRSMTSSPITFGRLAGVIVSV